MSTHTAATNTSGSDLLKRKTLKSIKRYRQTKQNTEPCNQLLPNQTMCIEEIAQNQLYNQYYAKNEQILNDYSQYNQSILAKQKASQQLPMTYNNNINVSSTSSSSGSGATNTSGYASHHGTSVQRQVSLKDGKQPLKSCLKRKDSQSSSQSQNSKTSGNSPLTNKRSHSSVTHTQQQQSLIVPRRASNFEQSKCAEMFVPFVGYLFTHDKKSATRYSYYNKLERTRCVRVFRELISNAPYEFYDEDDEDEEEEELNKNIRIQQGVSSSKSDNDLRVKKSVTFLAHVIEHRQNLRNRSGESSSASSSALATPTASSPYHNGNQVRL